jgi:lysozyme
MTLSDNGLVFIESNEGLVLNAYKDATGTLTIGYGHTGPDVTPGLVWTQQQADDALLADTQTAQDAVNRLVTVPLTQHQYDALVDFVFNVGVGNFTGSTLRKDLNAGNYEGAMLQFTNWVYSRGVKLPGLLKRRQAEADLFAS